jgi:hypothetical protein
VRTGVHTGEVAIVGGQARGVAVHAAARVAALAGRARCSRRARRTTPRRLGPLVRVPRRARAEGAQRRASDLRAGALTTRHRSRDTGSSFAPDRRLRRAPWRTRSRCAVRAARRASSPPVR